MKRSQFLALVLSPLLVPFVKKEEPEIWKEYRKIGLPRERFGDVDDLRKNISELEEARQRAVEYYNGHEIHNYTKIEIPTINMNTGEIGGYIFNVDELGVL